MRIPIVARGAGRLLGLTLLTVLLPAHVSEKDGLASVQRMLIQV